MAAVGIVTLGNGGKCSGTLIAPNLVLTAGHCVMSADRQSAKPLRGMTFETGEYPGHDSQTYEVREVAVHPLYIGTSPNRPDSIIHDAALVYLAASVSARVAAPIPVVPSQVNEAPLIASYRGGKGDRARERRCPLVENWRDVLLIGCDVGAGESGAPVLTLRNGELGVVGIVSASTRKKRTQMALAVKTDRVLQGINAPMSARGALKAKPRPPT